MLETISSLPFSFWIAIIAMAAGFVSAAKQMRTGLGIPMFAVIGTVGVWYVCDAFYNDYAHSYAIIFEPDILQKAWLEVALFVTTFFLATPYLHRWFNARYLNNPSGVIQLVKHGMDQPLLQLQLNVLFNGCVVVYAIIVLVAVIRLKSQILYFFFPFLGYKAEPWGRERIGSGFDALLSFAFYIQMMVTTVFGVIAGVSNRPRTRYLALIFCFLSWPYFLFDRTRNSMLAIVIPAILSWVFLRLRGSIWKKVIVLGGAFIIVNGWMAFVIANRSTESIAAAFRQKGFNLEQDSEIHHEGLNMFEELCWINTFIKDGSYRPNWGERYFAELVNPIPRVLWHNKPLIGIDYAIARGLGVRGAGPIDAEAGVYATVSTGFIGQGVVNFSGFLGPIAAALLMSFWAAILARQDLQIWKLGRLPLYACGLILTFNLGRDITFITLYPFVFGMGALWWIDRYLPQLSNRFNQRVYQTHPQTGQRIESNTPHRRNALPVKVKTTWRDTK